jgi:hypothetical protein
VRVAVDEFVAGHPSRVGTHPITLSVGLVPNSTTMSIDAVRGSGQGKPIVERRPGRAHGDHVRGGGVPRATGGSERADEPPKG